MTTIVGILLLILAFPTLASSMTGYSPNNEAFIIDGEQIMSYSDHKWTSLLYIIHDGWRVGLDGDHQVPWYMAPYSSNVVRIRRTVAIWKKANQLLPSWFQLSGYGICSRRMRGFVRRRGS